MLLLNTLSGGQIRTNAGFGINANPGSEKLYVNGGRSVFNGAVRINQAAECATNEFTFGWYGRFYETPVGNRKLNIIHQEEVNLCVQANRASEPVDGTIFIQMNDTNGILLNKATTCDEVLTLNNDILHGTENRIFQRADTAKSINIITTGEMNLCCQSDRTADPLSSDVFIQISTKSITSNFDVDIIGDLHAESNLTCNTNLNVSGISTFESNVFCRKDLVVVENSTFQGGTLFLNGLSFQNTSSIYEVLNGADYDLYVVNSDTDRAINLSVGTVGAPELSISEAKVNLLGHLDITHFTTGLLSERITLNNPDSIGLTYLAIEGNNICEVSSTGLHVNGAVSETSDKRLKENIKEINTKKCVELIKYIKPKTYNYIGKERPCVGYVADDFKESKMPSEWGNIVFEGDDGYLRLDLTKTTPILWSALQSLIKEVETLKKEVSKLKGKGKGN